MLSPPVRVCFVCSGNICRSPTAEVVFSSLAADAGLDDLVEVSSAGTGSWHAGDDMDARSRRTLVEGGYSWRRHVARQFVPPDFADCDLVVALDTGHSNVLWWLAAETADPAAAREKIVRLRSFDPELTDGADPDVPDPYYGKGRGFTEVLEQVERSCAALLDQVVRPLSDVPMGRVTDSEDQRRQNRRL